MPIQMDTPDKRKGDKMIRIITGKALKKREQKAESEGISKGYELGYMMRQTENSNRGLIIGSEVEEQIKSILRERGIVE